jgi:hypothetical protein
VRLSQKYPTQTMKKASGVAQEVEWLPSKCEILSSNPSTVQKEKFILYYLIIRAPITINYLKINITKDE